MVINSGGDGDHQRLHPAPGTQPRMPANFARGEGGNVRGRGPLCWSLAGPGLAKEPFPFRTAPGGKGLDLDSFLPDSCFLSLANLVNHHVNQRVRLLARDII